MHPRSKLSQAQREQAVELFEQGYGARAVANRLGVKRDQVRSLAGRFRLHGRLCLVSKPTRKQYSFATKMEILRRHKAGETKADLAAEFGLSSPDLIGHWVWEVNKDGIDALRPNPVPQDPPQPTRRQREAGAVGLDFGVNQLATLSTGQKFPNPRHLARAEKKIKRTQRKLARAQKGSKGRRKLVQRLARHQHTVALQRRGFLNELTTALAGAFTAIGIEDLNVPGMTASGRGTVDNPGKNVKQKAGLNRSILDASPGEFRRQLEYKCTERGVELVAVGQFFPSLLSARRWYRGYGSVVLPVSG